jgi:hypothetical protein
MVCHGDKSMTERFGHNDVIAKVSIWTIVQPSVRSLDHPDFIHHLEFTWRFGKMER